MLLITNASLLCILYLQSPRIQERIYKTRHELHKTQSDETNTEKNLNNKFESRDGYVCANKAPHQQTINSKFESKETFSPLRRSEREREREGGGGEGETERA